MVRRVVDIFSALALFLMLLASPALASTPATQPTDPNAGSPAGVMYAIPLDSARQDAAPHGHPGSAAGATRGSGSGGTGGSGGTNGSGGTGGSGSGSTAGASHTSGTSSASGGASAGSKSSARTGAAGTVGLVPGGQPGSLIHSANGFGSSSLVPGLRGPLGSTVSPPPASSSSAPELAMLLSLVLLGAGLFVGTRAWRRPVRTSRSQASST